MSANYQSAIDGVNNNSRLGIYHFANSENNARMEIDEVRRLNARALAETVGGQSGFIEKTGKAQALVSQWIGRVPRRNIGRQAAREIENAFGRPRAWLDAPHYDFWIEQGVLPPDFVAEPPLEYDTKIHLTAEEWRLVQLYRDLPPRRQKGLLDLLGEEE